MVLGIPENLYAQHPIFDQSGNGIVFNAVDLPNKKLGVTFCLNRPTGLYYIADPIFEKKKLDEKEDSYLTRINPENEYLAMQPKFNKAFTKLAYVGRDEVFLSHSGVYQLKTMQWPVPTERESTNILGVFKEYPTRDAEYGGLYGYNDTYAQSGFLHDSDRFYVIPSEILG